MQDTSSAEKPKRVISCAECRRLKIKCDLRFPCRHCVKRGLGGVCPKSDVTQSLRRMSKANIAETEVLEARIRELETQLQIAHHRTVTAPESTLEPVALPSEEDMLFLSTRPSHSARITGHGRMAMGSRPEVSRYYGSASSIYLSSRDIPFSTDAGAMRSPHALISGDHYMTSATSSAPCSIPEILDRHLPPMHIGTALADVYFQSIAWFTMIVQQRTWDETFFDHVYRSEPQSEPQKLAVFFLVIGLGSLMDVSQPPNSDYANQFLSAARLCLALDDTHSTTYVQCIQLYCLFITHGGKDIAPGETIWPLIRHAIAIAEELGLHRDGSNWQMDERYCEERRTIFWEIHGYDIFTSVGLGRGQGIAERSIDCAMPTVNDDLAFHPLAFKVTRIWSRVNDLQIRVGSIAYTEVLDIDNALVEYEACLPPPLRHTRSPSLLELTDPGRKKQLFQRIMLALYVNEARLALHRGWFVRVLRDSPHDPLSSPYQTSFIACLEASRTIIDLVQDMMVVHGQLIYRRWHFFFHLFSACVCLAAAGIRAPTSPLARAVLPSLDLGVDLFRKAKRTEMATVERLHQQAVQAVDAGISQYTRPPEAESEELDLLGARCTTLSTSPTANTTMGFAPTASDAWALFNMAAETEPDQGFGDFDMDAFLRDMGIAS